MLRSLSDGVLGLLFPDRCVGCEQSGALLCDTCASKLRPYAERNIQHLSNQADSPLLETMAAYIFESPLREAIHALKYDGIQRFAPLLSNLLATHLQRYPIPKSAIVPVPLHPQRLAERGFNQSDLVSRPLSQALQLPLINSGLVRVRDTAHQVGLGVDERRKNMDGAFAWRSKKRPPPRVLLIDDVLTTGSTLMECATALHKVGVREVRALTIAHGSSNT